MWERRSGWPWGRGELGGSKWRLYIGGKGVERVNRFRYLGVMICPGLGMGAQVEGMAGRCAVATAGMGDLRRYGLETCRGIWEVMVKPHVMYAMGVIGPRMGAREMKRVDGIKARFWKRCLGVGNNTSNVLATKMVGGTYMMDDLCAMGIAFRGGEVGAYLEDRERREGVFREQEYEWGPAFRGERGWRGDLREAERGAVCRVTVHGMHHRLCSGGSRWHERGDGCECNRCGRGAGSRWHVLECEGLEGLGLVDRVWRLEGEEGGRWGRGGAGRGTDSM